MQVKNLAMRPQLKLCSLGAALVLAMAGCTGSVSENIKKDGTVEGEVRFPDLDKLTFKGGSFVQPAALASISAGINKKQLYAVLGRPHFRERSGAREWDYLFNFRNADGSLRQCRYKIIFDSDKLARSFFDKPENCSQQHAPIAVPTAPTTAPLPAAVPIVVATASAQAAPAIKPAVQADPAAISVYFGFDKRASVELYPDERAKLIALVRDYRQQHSQDPQVRLDAYTDRLGSSDYNLDLAQRRGESVRNYLISLGLAAELISINAHGAANATTTCQQHEQQALITCLAPNRRVVVTLQTISENTDAAD